MIARLKGWWRRRRAAPVVERSDAETAARIVRTMDERGPRGFPSRRLTLPGPDVGGRARLRAAEQERRLAEAERVYGRDSVQAEATRLGF